MQPFIDLLMHLPLEWFVFIGSIVEEIISPIPSFVVLVPAGASLEMHHGQELYGLVLALIAGAGRVVGACVLYWLAYTFQEKFFAKRERFFGVSLKDIKTFRARMGNKKEWWALFTMWAIPIFPGAPLSLGSGFIKLAPPVFATATFAGSVINALFYIYVGYFGLRAATALHVVEFLGHITLGVILIVLVTWWLVRRQRRRKNKEKKHGK